MIKYGNKLKEIKILDWKKSDSGQKNFDYERDTDAILLTCKSAVVIMTSCTAFLTLSAVK